jgi:hypothetical protein
MNFEELIKSKIQEKLEEIQQKLSQAITEGFSVTNPEMVVEKQIEVK